MRWITSPSRVGEWAYLCLLAFVSQSVLVAAEPAEPVSIGEPREGVSEVAEVETYIKTFVANGRKEQRAARDRRWKAIPELAALIVEVAREWSLDPLLVAVVVKYESSFYQASVGAVGELGLMQVWGKAARDDDGKPYDLDTSRGQLMAGCHHFVRCLEQCGGDVLSALKAYQSGQCGASRTGAGLRYREYLAVRSKR